MSFETMDYSMSSFIQMLKAHDISHFTIRLYGGEILINKKNVFRLIEKYKTSYSGTSIDWVLHTNGSLLTDEDAEFLKANDIDVHISCDGYAEVHNRNRVDKFGNNTFDKVKNGLEIIKKHRLKAQLNSYAMPENLNNLKDLVDLALEYEIDRVHLDYFYTPKMADNVFERYMEFYKYGVKKGITIAGPWSIVLHHYLRQDVIRNTKVPGIVVNSDGTFFFNSFPLSRNMKFDIHNFARIIASEEYAEFVRKADAYFEKTCRSCYLKDSCFGGAIRQYQYHTVREKGYEKSCNLTRDIVRSLTSGVE